MSNVLKHKIGLPVWDGDFVRDIITKLPGESLTQEELEEARQDEDEQAMLIEHNCYTEDDLYELNQSDPRAASVNDANEALPTQEET